jgi:alpha-glucosidase
MMLQKLQAAPVVARILLLLTPYLLVSARSMEAAVTSIGSVTSLTVSNDPTSGNSMYFFSVSNGGTAEVTPWAPDVVRVHYHYTSLFTKEEPMIARSFSNWPAVTTSITDQGTNYLIQTPQLNVLVNKSPFNVDFVDRNDGYTMLQDDPTNSIQYDPTYTMIDGTALPTGISRLKCTKLMPANQAYFGFGEYAGPSNRRGLNMMCWNHQSYEWGDGENPLYMNTPFFYGVQPAVGATPAFVYGIFLDNPCRATFRLGTQSSYQYSFEAGDGQMDYYFLGGGANHTTRTVIDNYSNLTGRPMMMPKWAMGYHLGRFSYWDQNWVQYIASTATASNIPLDAVYLDIDYMNYSTDTSHNTIGPLKQLTVNPTYYPNPFGMVTNAASFGVKLIPLIEPWLEPADPLYTGESTNNDFIKANSGATFTGNIFVGNVSWLDFTSTATTNRWQADEVNWFNAVPWGGIWNDLTEPEDDDGIPINALLWLDGRYGTSTTDTRRQWSNEKNYFVLASASSSHSTLSTVYPNRRPFVLTRSGNSGVQRYAGSWSGDTEANWYYNQACIRLGANTMISGQANFGHDLGGFIGTVTGELLTRWHEWGALLPLYINHSQKGDNVWPDGNQGREPWRFNSWQNSPSPDGTDYCGLMRKNIQFRYQLMPYLYTLMYNSTTNGLPINTPVFFNYYNDNNTLSLNEFDFLCGDSLLAAPIYTQGATTRVVYLPWPDDWYYYPTGTKYAGGQTVTVNAPLGTLPLFVRGGAIIPMGPSMQYANQFQPGYLDVNCWPDGNSSFTLYEDAGDGWDYTNGVYAMTSFTSSQTTSNWIFTLGARQGSYNPYSAGTRTLHIYVNNPQAVQDVLLNGTPIGQVSGTNSAAPGWLVNTNGQLVVLVSETGTQQTVEVGWNTSDPYSSMTVAGAFNGWNPAADNMEYIGGRTWQYDVSVSSVSNVQFKFAANGSWTTNWGGTGAAQTVPFSGVGIPDASTNIVVNGTLNGLYEFTFNDQTFDYSLQPLLASAYSSMNVPGTFDGWNPAANNMQLVSNDTWQSIIGFNNVTNIQFKFAADGNWTSNWGENRGTQSQFTLPLSGTGKSGGSTNILINAVLNGEYQFTFNDLNQAYAVQLFTGDSVGDGIPDSWRARYFGSTTNNYFGNTTNSQSCAACDPDGDGMNNLQEYLAGTDPTNSASVFHVTAVQPSGPDYLVSFTSVTGKVYDVESCTDLVSVAWSVVTNSLAGNNGILQITDPGAASVPQRFYRARLTP